MKSHVTNQHYSEFSLLRLVQLAEEGAIIKLDGNSQTVIVKHL